jgi:hypothetical protein
VIVRERKLLSLTTKTCELLGETADPTKSNRAMLKLNRVLPFKARDPSTGAIRASRGEF